MFDLSNLLEIKRTQITFWLNNYCLAWLHIRGHLHFNSKSEKNKSRHRPIRKRRQKFWLERRKQNKTKKLKNRTVLHPTTPFLSFLLFAGLPVSSASANYIQQIVERTKAKANAKAKAKTAFCLKGRYCSIFSQLFI